MNQRTTKKEKKLFVKKENCIQRNKKMHLFKKHKIREIIKII